jgi:hypothetical protein
MFARIVSMQLKPNKTSRRRLAMQLEYLFRRTALPSRLCTFVQKAEVPARKLLFRTEIG